jgi:hypothetical protein
MVSDRAKKLLGHPDLRRPRVRAGTPAGGVTKETGDAGADLGGRTAGRQAGGVHDQKALNTDRGGDRSAGRRDQAG